MYYNLWPQHPRRGHYVSTTCTILRAVYNLEAAREAKQNQL
jgi:hypothetical protein